MPKDPDEHRRPVPTATRPPPLASLRERLLGWKEILETANPPEHRPLDTVGKWLVITRAAVFPMTIWSGLIGGLLAVEAAADQGRRRRSTGACSCWRSSGSSWRTPPTT